jgi:hypothetical protein
MRPGICRTSAVVVGLFVFSGTVWAEGDPATLAVEPLSLSAGSTTSTTRATGTHTADLFPAGTWCAQVYGSYGSDLSNRNVRLAGANFGFGYYVFNNLALNLEGQVFNVDEPGPNGWAVALTALLRHHLIRADPFSFYMDVGFGPMEAQHDTPPGGTHFNFLTRVGPGFTCKLDEATYLLGGVRYLHISNAHLDNEKDNPSVNGVEGYIGMMFTF